ncbi:hypothetical protein C8Q72DRAFT_874195 [Fomitopsis betulina]|nr:hypothetical protein C8Q72DRAFT_874195 [Fomitopsis betulina]
MWNCLDPACRSLQKPAEETRHLTQLMGTKCVNYTQEYGPLPLVAYSARCESCGTRYHPNYYVHEHGHSRTYYAGIPYSTEIAKHTYIEATLTSASNNAKAYRILHQYAEACFPPGWSVLPVLRGTIVSDAFFLFALLQDHDEHGTTLVVENIEQSARIDQALAQRNEAIIGPGQELWSHICSRCCEQRTVDGNTLVTDGVTIGHPCCGVQDCKEKLLSQRARFCPSHSNLEQQCSIIGCTNEARPGHKSCSLISHQSLEQTVQEAQSALFQLRQRLERQHRSYPNNAAPPAADGDEVEDMDDADEETTGNTPDGPKLRARFGRRWTHNEQLCVATCGTILGRMTMSLPMVIFYDSACQLKKHLLASGDHYFDHSEMTNAWFGGFKSIVREMREERYDFFLDEVIKQHNRLTVGELGRTGANPQELARDWFLA